MAKTLEDLCQALVPQVVEAAKGGDAAVLLVLARETSCAGGSSHDLAIRSDFSTDAKIAVVLALLRWAARDSDREVGDRLKRALVILEELCPEDAAESGAMH